MAQKKNNQKENEALNLEETISRSEMFIEKNKKLLVGIILLLVLLIAAIYLYKNYYVAARENKAQVALIQGQNYFQAGNFEAALNGDSISYKGFVDVVKNYGSTKAGNLAKGYAGLSLAQMGKYKEALEYLKGFKAKDAMIGPAVKGSMGDCYANLEQPDKAVELWREAANAADNNTVSPIFLKKAGVVLLEQGKADEALKLFQTIRDKYFNSMVVRDIDAYIERAELLKQSK